jgi:hypothetical protein
LRLRQPGGQPGLFDSFCDFQIIHFVLTLHGTGQLTSSQRLSYSAYTYITISPWSQQNFCFFAKMSHPRHKSMCINDLHRGSFATIPVEAASALAALLAEYDSAAVSILIPEQSASSRTASSFLKSKRKRSSAKSDSDTRTILPREPATRLSAGS